MDILLKELATLNLFIIWLIVFGGVAFLKIIKKNLLE